MPVFPISVILNLLAKLVWSAVLLVTLHYCVQLRDVICVLLLTDDSFQRLYLILVQRDS